MVEKSKLEGNLENAQEEQNRPKLSNIRQIMLTAYWFSNGFLWSALMSVAMPSQIRDAVGDDDKNSMLGVVTAAGAFLSLFAAPIFGSLSDRIQLPGNFGLRKPWMIIGVTGVCVGLLGCAYLIHEAERSSVIPFTISYCLVVLFSNVATAPYAAMLPDNVAENDRGSTSGYLGIMTLLGNLTGGLTGYLIDQLTIAGVYYVMIGIQIIGLLTVYFGVNEVRKTIEPDVKSLPTIQFLKSLLTPLKSKPFLWVLLVRLFFKLGQAVVSQYMQNFLRDVIGDGKYQFFGLEVAKKAEEAVGVFQGASLFGGIATSLIAGKLSHKLGNKRIVWIALFFNLTACACVMWINDFTTIALFGIGFGLGFGMYLGVDFALVTDVLPSKDDYAKDMGIWHTTDVVPQIIAGVAGGFLIDIFQQVGKDNDMESANLGYKANFTFAILSSLLAGFFISRLHEKKQ